MKLVALFIFAACLQVSARGLAQVTIAETHAPLQKIFKEIKRQTGYEFLFSSELLQKAGPVTIDLHNVTLTEAMDACLKDQPLSYEIVGKTVVIKPAAAGKVPERGQAVSLPLEIHGRVTDSLGNPLAGASVTVKGLKRGVETDGNGGFILKGVDDHATLLVSFTGYIPREIALEGRTAVIVVLSHNSNPLDEVVIIAYGTTTRRYNVGDVGSVKSEAISKQPVDNPLLALQGRVPGLVVTQSTGLPGSGVTVRIQGQNSIGNGNDPLYVIDGVPYVQQLLPLSVGVQGTSGNGAFSGNPLSYIDPADIESIDILKDADATAIYGSRAASGAILITTKKGKAGKTKLDLHVRSGLGQITRKLDLLDTKQYLQMRREAKRNDNSAISPTDYDMNGFWDTTRSTDWQKAFIGGTAQYTDANANVSGGTQTTQYLVGGTFHRETTVMPGPFADEKGSLHFNINSASTDRKFRLQLSGSYLIDKTLLPGSDLTSFALVTPPDASALYNSDGTLNWAQSGSGSSAVSTFLNPLANALYNPYTNKTGNLIGNAALAYNILPGLEISANLGYTNLQTNELVTTPVDFNQPEYRLQYGNSLRNALYGNNNVNSWIAEPQATYKRKLGKGKLEALVGATIEQQNSNREELSGSGYNSDAVLADIKSAATVTVVSTVSSVYKYNAAFGRLNYNWDDKYLIDLTARRDGSSRFGSRSQFHNFGAIGAGWIFSNEEVFKDKQSFVSYGKLRASYGTTGNDQIGDYNFLSQYIAPSAVGIPYQGSTGLVPKNISNPYLEWEETRKLQFGMDLGIFRDRILVDVDYYLNRSSNQLLGYPLPIWTGFASVMENFPATVQNSGWEVSLNTTNIKTATFSWSTSFNMNLPENKLVAFPGLAASSYASTYFIGRPVTITRVYHSLGVDPATGIYQFADVHGNPTPTPKAGTDNTVVINTAPTFNGGFGNDLRYKGFELDVLFTFVMQKAQNYYFGSNPGSYDVNQPASVLARWQKAGDMATVQRFNSNFSLFSQWSNMTLSDAAWTDASYARLKNLSLSWQLPAAWRRKAHLEDCHVYAQGQNLLTITRYRGMDPENKGALSSKMPMLRVVTLGVQIGL